MISFVPSIVTFVRHAKRPSGAPAAYAASATTRSASAVHVAALGCGLITMPHRALAEMMALYIAVAVGFVLGISAATTPIGVATSHTLPSSSLRTMPAVFIPRIRSWSVRVAKRFFCSLLSGRPKPVSSCAIWPRRAASRAPASTIASTIVSTSSCGTVLNWCWASRTRTSASRAS